MEDIRDISEDQEKPALEPAITRRSALHADLTRTPVNNFEPLNGEYHLVELKNGEEVPGSDFSIGETTFRQVFEALLETKFRLKKKQNI